MDNSNFVVSPIKNRFFAFLIDVFFIYLLRFLYINISIQFWLKDYLIKFLEKYKMLYGSFDLGRITNIEVMFFLRSDLFKNLVLFVLGMFIISMLYDTVFLLTKWSATLGQKICGIYVVSKDGQKIKWYQCLIRGVMMNTPWMFIFFIIVGKNLSMYEINVVDTQTFIISMLLFLSWYDLAFLTKSKIVFHDYVAKTLVVVKNKEKYLHNNGGILNILFPDFRDLYKNLKASITTQIKNAKEMKQKYKEEKEKNKNK